MITHLLHQRTGTPCCLRNRTCPGQQHSFHVQQRLRSHQDTQTRDHSFKPLFVRAYQLTIQINNLNFLSLDIQTDEVINFLKAELIIDVLGKFFFNTLCSYPSKSFSTLMTYHGVLRYILETLGQLLIIILSLG